MLLLGMISRLIFLFILVKCEEFTVNTSYGSLRGRDFQSRYGRTVKAFSGIPFAKPPIGKLRFRDPEPPEPWSGVKDAYNFGSVCVQVTYYYYPIENTTLGNEDCLYLSVYTPSIKPKKLLPVLVYFHGGGFFQGSGEVDRSPEFFMDHDIVVVMPNYRLNIFGFFSLEDETQPGNMGLKDQNMALVWVHDNIANFGGDPQRVTLIGESAGSASVHHHMYSPLSQELFHGVFSLSGYALSPWALTPPGVAKSNAIKVADAFKCPTDSSDKILECLRTRSAYDLTRHVKSSMAITSENPVLTFAPIWDKYAKNPFHPKNPHHTEPAAVPWLTGVTSLEGLILTGGFIRFPKTLELLNEQFNRITPQLLFFQDTASNPDEVAKKIRKYYFGNQPISNFLFKNVTDMASDVLMYWPMIKSLQKHNGPHYVYYFDYLGENNFQEVFAGRQILRGAIHGDDLLYIWKNNNPISADPPRSDDDLKFSNSFLKLIVNFVTTGNPTPPGSEFEWPIWDDVEQHFIGMENRGFMQYQHFFRDRMQFWDEQDLTAKIRDEVNK